MLHIRIRELRQARGRSQVELAKCLPVTTDSLLDMDGRSFLEVTGVSAAEIAHIQQIIDDIKAR